jgi:hypothetical protein
VYLRKTSTLDPWALFHAGAEPHQLEQARQLLAGGKGIVNTAKASGWAPAP